MTPPVQWDHGWGGNTCENWGKVLHEQGGYRDTTTYLDRLLDRAKNKPVLVWIYLIASGLAMAVTILAVISLFK